MEHTLPNKRVAETFLKTEVLRWQGDGCREFVEFEYAAL